MQNIKKTIENLFDVVKERSSKEELVFICPNPGCGDKSGNRSVNLKTGATNCWRCNEGHPNIFKWLKKKGIDVEEVEDDNLSESPLDGLFDESKERQRIAYTSDIKLPRGFTPLTCERTNAYERLIGKMAVRKNLELGDFVRVGVGYTTIGAWEKYAIFPVYEWGKPVYYQGRTYRDVKGESTKKFPSRSEVPDGSRNWIYNIDKMRLSTTHTAIIVESILNVLSLEKELLRRGVEGVVPVAIFKHKISKEQMVKLMAVRNVKEICLMFDSDATADAQTSAASVTNRRKVTVVSMPHKVDANDDAKTAVDLFVNERKSFNSPMSDLEAQLAGL